MLFCAKPGEFRYVKPDKRLLEWVSHQWDMEPSEIIMVGDSTEDIEVGAASGTYTCRILEGQEVCLVSQSYLPLCLVSL